MEARIGENRCWMKDERPESKVTVWLEPELMLDSNRIDIFREWEGHFPVILSKFKYGYVT